MAETSNKDQKEFDEFQSYGNPPASQINLNINLTELPKCTKDSCGGVFVPIQWTSNPKSGAPGILCVGWVCLSCGNNTMYSNGKIIQQPIIQENTSM